MTDEPCTREHLRAIVQTATHWVVDNEGTPFQQVSDDEGDGQIEEYCCTNCHEQFAPDKPHCIEQAWEEAAAHLNAKETQG